MPPDVQNEYFIRYDINQHNLLTGDKYLERVCIFINCAECQPAGRIKAPRTCNELHIPKSFPSERNNYPHCEC